MRISFDTILGFLLLAVVVVSTVAACQDATPAEVAAQRASTQAYYTRFIRDMVAVCRQADNHQYLIGSGRDDPTMVPLFDDNGKPLKCGADPKKQGV
jgi:hypothetical protein